MAEMRPMAVVTSPGVIALQDVPVPPLGPADVRIEVGAVTLCGSDLHVFKGKHPSVSLPIPVGHEIAGRVAALGAEVTRVQVGDRVAVEPVIVCDECAYCVRGQYHLCANISFQYRHWQGGLTPVFIADQRWVHRLPDSLNDIEGALLEPLSVVVHATGKADILPGAPVAVFGDGAIGLLLTQVARARGAGEIYLAGIRESRLQAGMALGATEAIDNRTTDAVARIRAATDGLGAELAFEAVGIPQTLRQSIEAVRKGGTVVMVGLFESAEVSFPANQIVQRELSVIGAQGYSWDFPRAISMVQQGSVQLREMVTHTFPLEEVQAAFDLLMEPDTPAVKVAVTMGTER